MFINKKINYIFASFGDEIVKNTNKSTFFNKLIKKNSTSEIIPLKEKQTFEISEKFILEISKFTDKKCFSFYFNLKNTHEKFIQQIKESKADRFFVFFLFPQYRPDISLIANFFSSNLNEITNKLFWIKSFHNNLLFIKAIQKNIKNTLKKYELDEKDTILLFLANAFENCDLYTYECEISAQNIIKAFQFIEGSICFYKENEDFSKIVNNPRKKILIIPITTLIDDIETQKKINSLQNFLERQKKIVFICKTLNHSPHFSRSILDIIDEKSLLSNKMISSF